MDWNDVRVFLTVAREGSMRAAGRALGLSQPTIARRLAAFEASFGGPTLFDRLPEGLRINAAGVQLISAAESIEVAQRFPQFNTAAFAFGVYDPSGAISHAETAVRALLDLAKRRGVDIVEGDGALISFDTADVIYVNAGCTRPAESWLDRLADGGRLILPMTSDQGFGAKDQGLAARSLAQIERAGAVFCIERRGKDYLANWISGVAIFPCAGSRDETSERALAEAFAKGGWQKVTRLYRDQELPDERCWLRGSGWCLAHS